jgi:hypothetical protein
VVIHGAGSGGMVQVAIVQIVHMVTMSDRGMPTVGTVGMRVIRTRLAHPSSSGEVPLAFNSPA